MAHPTCAVDDCQETKIQARGWCARHYFRWIKSGRVSPIPPVKEPKRCSIEGCDKKYRCSGYCGYHYMRWFETGSPEPPAPRPTECSVSSCSRAPRSLGMCQKHYERVVRTGTTDDPQPRPRGKCKVPGCSHPKYVAFGCCRIHYRRLRLYGSPTGTPGPRPEFPCSVNGCGGTRRRSPGLCKRHVARLTYNRNIERIRERDRVRRSGDGAVRRSAQRRAIYWANPEEGRAESRAWRAANRERANRLSRESRRRNRDAVRARNQRRRALQKNAPINDFTAQQWRDIKAAYRYRCAYCHKRRRLTADHVVPLIAGGPHTASNIVPACQSCNSKKGPRPAPTYQPLLL